VKKLLKLLGLGLVIVFGAQSSVHAVCRRCMVNRAGAVQNFDFEQEDSAQRDAAPACIRQLSEKTVAVRKLDKQADKQIGKQAGAPAGKLAGKLQDAKAKVAAWAQAAQKRMAEAGVRLANWAQVKARWVSAKKQALVAYIKSHRNV